MIIANGYLVRNVSPFRSGLERSFGPGMAGMALLAILCVLFTPPSVQGQYSLSQNIYTVGSNPPGNALDPFNNPIGGVPSISWIFNAPVAGPATLSILAEGIDSPGTNSFSGELDAVLFNGNPLGNLVQQGFYSPLYNLQPGPGALAGITAETISTFNVIAIAGLNTVTVNVDAGNWVNEIEASTLSTVPEPGAFGLGMLALLAWRAQRRLGGRS